MQSPPGSTTNGVGRHFRPCLRLILLVAFMLGTQALVKQEYDRQHQRRHTMGDKGGKKDKDKDQKQKANKHAKDMQEMKDKQPKSAKK
jgi:hypothetical protein